MIPNAKDRWFAFKRVAGFQCRDARARIRQRLTFVWTPAIFSYAYHQDRPRLLATCIAWELGI